MTASEHSVEVPAPEDRGRRFLRSLEPGSLPWSWPTLTPDQRRDLAELVDRFVATYNRWWAPARRHVPWCWYRHSALAIDLAALMWNYYAAYREPDASAELAMRFQDHLVDFDRRVDRWLGPDAARCRDGGHPVRHAHDEEHRPARTTQEERDAVTLLGQPAPPA